MATVPPSTLQLSNPIFSFSLASSTQNIHPHRPPFPARATANDSESSTDAPAESSTGDSSSEGDSFDSRLSQVRLRYRSGTGKKAEIRKSRKGKRTATSSAGIYLPPVPLKEPVSGGIKVDFGFSPYSERVNGRIAMLGLSALLLVELATGKSVINYHSPAIVFVQVYFVAAVAALYVKYEKEKVSVWPESAPNQN